MGLKYYSINVNLLVDKMKIWTALVNVVFKLRKSGLSKFKPLRIMSIFFVLDKDENLGM